MRPFLTHEYPLRFAHRGSCILWPENTLLAFQGAVDLGYRYIETDIHRTRDGVLVIFHDDRLERVTNGKGLVKDWYWDELRQLDAAWYFNAETGFPLRNQGVHIPSLEEVITTFPGILPNIDLKQPGIEQALADFIGKHHLEERVLVASFYDSRVRRFRRISRGRVATSAARWETAAFLACARMNISLKIKADALQVPVRMGGITVIDEKLIQAAHAVGKQVHAWTIDDPAEMRRLLALGVDGIVTNRPDLLLKISPNS